MKSILVLLSAAFAQLPAPSFKAFVTQDLLVHNRPAITRTHVSDPMQDFLLEPCPVVEEDGVIFRYDLVTDVTRFDVDISGDGRPEVFLRNANEAAQTGVELWTTYMPTDDGYVRFAPFYLRSETASLGTLGSASIDGQTLSLPGSTLLGHFPDRGKPDWVRAYYIKNGRLVVLQLRNVGTPDFIGKYFSKLVSGTTLKNVQRQMDYVVTPEQQADLKPQEYTAFYDPWVSQEHRVRRQVADPFEDYFSENDPISDENGETGHYEFITEIEWFEADIGGDERPEVFLRSATAPLYSRFRFEYWTPYTHAADGNGYIRYGGAIPLNHATAAIGEIGPTRTKGRTVATFRPSLLWSIYDPRGPDLIRAYYIKDGRFYDQPLGDIGTSDFIQKYFSKRLKIKRISRAEWEAEHNVGKGHPNP